jgi:hypothetical protein
MICFTTFGPAVEGFTNVLKDMSIFGFVLLHSGFNSFKRMSKLLYCSDKRLQLSHTHTHTNTHTHTHTNTHTHTHTHIYNCSLYMLRNLNKISGRLSF